MTQNDIRKLYTEKVADLLAQGYQINPATMGGSQGEIAHIDLTNGAEILRVLIEREPAFGKAYDDFIVITVGRNTDPVRDNRLDGWDTIWNNRLEILSKITMARITDNYFVTPGKGKAMAQVRAARRKRAQENNRRELGEASKSIALRWLKRTQKGFKSAKPADVERVVRVNRTEFDRVTPELSCYEIHAKGKTFCLYPPRHS